METLQSTIFIEFDVNTKKITFLRKDNVIDYDSNTTSIYVRVKYKNLSGNTVYLTSSELEDYKFSLYTIKPATNNVNEIIGEVTDELKENVYGGVVKFEIPRACTNRLGIVKCEIHINQGNKIIASSRFVLDVKQSLITAFDDELLGDEDFPVLKQLILEIQKDSNIDDNNRSKTSTYSSDKIENIRKDLDLQIKEKANNVDLLVERARIDAFTKLSEGSTTGDAELIDARIGADATEYESLGEAIRTQVRLLSNKKVDKKVLYDLNNINITLENGSITSLIVNSLIPFGSQEYWKHTILDCNPNDIYYVSLRTGNSNIDKNYYIVFADKNLNYISSFNMSGYEDNTEYKDIEVVIPNNVYKLVIASFSSNLEVKVIDTEDIDVVRREDLEPFNKSLYDLYLNELNITSENGSITSLTPGSPITFGTQDYWHHTVVDCNPNNVYYVSLMTGRPGLDKNYLIVFADRDLNYISSFDMSTYEDKTEHNDIKVTIPNNVYKLVVASFNLNPSVKIIDTEHLNPEFVKDEINKYNELVLKYYKPKNNTVHFSSRQGEFNGVKDNTLEGIKLACKNGFEKIRLSINYTKDGVWVLTHDADITIEGTQYTINNTDYSVLQDYLVTLDEGIKLARKLSLIVQLEIKNATEDLIVEAWKIVARNMMHNNVIWNQWGNSINQWVNKIKSLQENAKLSISGAWSLDLIEKAHALQNARNEVIIGIYPPSEPTEEQILKVAEYGLETIVSSVYNISQLVEAISYANEIETSNMIMPVSGLIDDGLNN